jgi:hypothetical protein
MAGFQLGASIDGEVDGVPSNLADGEGQVGDGDDGVVIVSNNGVLKTGDNTLRVTVQGVGGLLTGWMDFNNDGQFDESERLTWSLNGTDLGGEADLDPGTWNLHINVPASAQIGALAARFRWGEQGLSFDGPANIGEVEDYRFGVSFLFGDYNRNGSVDLADYNVWRRAVGQNVTPFTGADGNGDGLVDQADLDVWKANFGKTLPAPGAGSLALDANYANSGVGSGNGALAYNGTAGFTSAGGALGSGVGSSSAFGPSRIVTFASMSTSVGDDTTVEPNFTRSSRVIGSTSNANLLLLDLAWANHSDSVEPIDESLYEAGHDENANANDVALASALSDGANWWDVL